MKQSNYDKWLTTDPNGEPAPQLIRGTVECYGDKWDAFAIDELTCQDCDAPIGFVLTGERDDNGHHNDFVYHDIGGDERFVCVACAKNIDEYAELVK